MEGENRKKKLTLTEPFIVKMNSNEAEWQYYIGVLHATCFNVSFGDFYAFYVST